MSQHELTKEEKFHIRTQEEIDLNIRIFAILEDLENRIKILETKIT